MALNQRAQRVREELYKRYDTLNALWLKAEEEITKLHIPHAIKYEYDPDPNGRAPSDCLGVVKIKGKWRICHGSFIPWSDPWPSDWTPIIECSAAIRVGVVKYLPKLREAVVEAAEQFIPRVDQAIAELENALAPDNDMATLLADRAKLNGRAKP